MNTMKIGMSMLAVLLVSVLTSAAYAFTADSVLSHDIREADGTTGQNTGTGSGVKTGHIQDSAVTTTKISDGSITTGKIGDGAVTDAKISGPIAGTKISSAGLNADTVDGMHAADLAPALHTHVQSQVSGLEAALAAKAEVTHDHDSLYQQKYGKVAVVAQTGGDYTHPIDAVNNVASWCGTPSAANRCLIKIMPGLYNFNMSGIEVPDYTDIEGSGENVTTLLNTTVFTYYHQEVRSLTIENNSGMNSTGIWTAARQGVRGGPVKITNVTIKISNVTYPQAIVHGICLDMTADYTLKDVTINLASMPATAYGILSWMAVGKMSGVTINAPSAPVGIQMVVNSVATINYSTISAVQTVVSDASTVRIASTNVNGAAPTGVNGGTAKCLGLFDGDYAPVVCQ